MWANVFNGYAVVATGPQYRQIGGGSPARQMTIILISIYNHLI